MQTVCITYTNGKEDVFSDCENVTRRDGCITFNKGESFVWIPLANTFRIEAVNQ